MVHRQVAPIEGGSRCENFYPMIRLWSQSYQINALCGRVETLAEFEAAWPSDVTIDSPPAWGHCDESGNLA